MFRFLFIWAVCAVLLAYVDGANYSLPALKDEIANTWTLSAFASMIRDSILSANPFPWEFVKNMLDSDNEFDMMAAAQEVVMIELPLLIPFILGLLCVVFVPIVALLFCCCRCCCKNCGAKLSKRDIQNQKPIPFFVNVLLVLLMIGILCAMGSCIPPSGNRLKTSPRMVFRVVEASLDDLKIFLDAFVKDASSLAKTTLNTTIESLKTELDALPDSLAQPVTDGATPYVEKIETKMESISTGIAALITSGVTLNATVDGIVGLVADLQTGITNINTQWSNLKNQCVTDGETFCDQLPDGTGPSALNVNINTTELTDMKTTVAELVSSAAGVDLSQYQNLGNTTFTEIPGTIRNASQSAVDGVKTSLDTVPAEIEPVIDTALEAAELDMDLSDILDPLDKDITMLEDNYPLIHTISLAIGAVLIVLSLIVFAGCALGALCTRQSHSMTQSGRTKAGNCGARLLMLYVCVAILPVVLSILLGSVMMLIGANMTMMCQPLQDLTIFEEIVDNGLIFGGDSLGEVFMNDANFSISIAYLFRTCRKNETVFKGLNIQSGMDLASHFETGEFVPDLGDDLINDVNSTISGISIVDTSLFNDLTSKLDLPDINTTITSTIITEINNLDLPGTAQTMTDLANTLTKESYKTAYQALSVDLQNLHDNTSTPLTLSVTALQITIDGLNSTCASLKTTITALSTDLNDLTTFVNTEAVTVIVQALTDFLAAMLKVPEDMINSVLDTLGTDVGHCMVLSNIYDTFLAAVCGHFLDSFNTLWAAFYTGGMVAVLLMICSCCLTKYFRTPDDMLQMRINQHQNIGYHANPSRGMLGGSDIILTRYRNLSPTTDSDNENNNAAATFNNHHERVNQRWQQRRKFVTGSFSAQLFKAMTTSNKVQPEPSACSNTASNDESIPLTMVDPQDTTHFVNQQGAVDNTVQVYDLENLGCTEDNGCVNSGYNPLAGSDDNNHIHVTSETETSEINEEKEEFLIESETDNETALIYQQNELKKYKLPDCTKVKSNSVSDGLNQTESMKSKQGPPVIFPKPTISSCKLRNESLTNSGMFSNHMSSVCSVKPKPKVPPVLYPKPNVSTLKFRNSYSESSGMHSNHLFGCLDGKCSVNPKPRPPPVIYPKPTVSSCKLRNEPSAYELTEDRSVVHSKRRSTCFSKIGSIGDFNDGKIVCALCKNKINPTNFLGYASDKNNNNETAMHDATVTSSRNDLVSLGPQDSTELTQICKTSVTGIETSMPSGLNSEADKVFLQWSKSDNPKPQSSQSSGKLELRVEAYRHQQQPFSPREAFQFWHEVDGGSDIPEQGGPDCHDIGEHSCKTISAGESVPNCQEINETTLKINTDTVYSTRMTGKEFKPNHLETVFDIKKKTVAAYSLTDTAYNITDPAYSMTDPMLDIVELGYELQSEDTSYSKGLSASGYDQSSISTPDSLQRLSVRAGQKLYCYDNITSCNNTSLSKDCKLCMVSSERSHDSHVTCDVERSHDLSKGRRISQPNSLSRLAEEAVVNAERSMFYPGSGSSHNVYGYASTRRDNVPLTYC